MDARTRGSAMKRVGGSRWLSGFVTAMVVVSAIGAVAIAFRGLGTAEAPQVKGTVASTAVGLMAIKGLAGDPNDPNHKDWLVIESFSWGVLRSGASSPGVSGPVSITEVSVVKKIDKSSPQLALAAGGGRIFSEVKIDLCRSTCQGPDKYMEYRLENTMVSSFTISGGQDIPTESISFNFTKMSYKYTGSAAGAGEQTLACPRYDLECTRE